MIKKTLYFGSPSYLSTKLNQLVIKKVNEKGEETINTVPIEDLGFIVLDCQQITISQGLLEHLLENSCAVITCNDAHLPTGLMLPLNGNSIQNERFRAQLDASVPLKKQMWQQTVQFKIFNQAAILKYSTGEVHNNMSVWAKSVRSGDPDNFEARAAAYYWKTLFVDKCSFIREKEGDFPNNFLNYGYAIVRAVIARALTMTGLLPTLGIHHHNRYNAYCLADDIMEPYRPYVDKIVLDIIKESDEQVLSTEIKKKLLAIPTTEVLINGERSPLMVAASFTSASVAKCFNGELRKISYPVIE